jgi:hypothetical protein
MTGSAELVKQGSAPKSCPITAPTVTLTKPTAPTMKAVARPDSADIVARLIGQCLSGSGSNL